MKSSHSSRNSPRHVAQDVLCLTSDARRLRNLQRDLQRANGNAREKVQSDLAALLAQSREAVEARRARLPRPEFQPELPVNEKRADIAELIANNQVVIVCGETGSGKTTQLPKICLDLGIGARGLIGHTQPRRLAARSVATRLAQELKTQVGAGVGVKIRFHDKSTPESWVKLMTDGILLAESQSDTYLNAYEAIIIDEAHERSLNIDFLLGYLKQLLPKRPDLKVIITSATIDAERFSQHFSLNGKPAPVIEVSGRLYPVEVRYRPVDDLEKQDDERDLYDAIVDAADEVSRLGAGDILVFLPGEREIREAAEALRKHALARPGLSTAHAPEILPLFSRLSAGEQDRIFKPSGNQRRIVLATNVAETSLTVPGIRYVIDSGLARVKRYSYRNKVEQLQVEKISQAAARQRAGRCGRVAAGVCVRLYDEADFNARPPFTDPEILRSSLAGVILRMKSLRLTDVETFPFIEPPPSKAISDGYALLQELGGLDDENRLTKVGEALAKLPLDPRIGRMLVAARDLGCLKSYEAFRSRGRDEYWSEHSVQVPALLAERFPNEITILPQTAFFDPDWTREGLKKMFYGVSDFPEARAFHLWEAVAWNVLVHFNEKNILHLDNTYAHAVKRIIGEDVERLAAKRDAWVAEGFAQTVAKVNLGCGAKRHPEFVNCDLYPEGGPDLVFDLVEGDWPIPTSSVELVWVHHVLEHVAGDVKTFFQELHRITKDGAITEIRVPHPRHDWFLMDPTHVRAWHADSFAFLDKETCFEWLFSGDSKSPLALYWNVDFVVEHVENRVADQAIRRHLAEAFGPGLVLEKAANHLNNVVGEIVVRLRTRKGAAA